MFEAVELISDEEVTLNIMPVAAERLDMLCRKAWMRDGSEQLDKLTAYMCLGRMASAFRGMLC